MSSNASPVGETMLPEQSTQAPHRVPKFRILTLALLILGIIGIGFGAADQPTGGSVQLPDGSESKEVAKYLESLPGDETAAAIALFHINSPQDLGALQDKATKLGGPLIPSQDGKSAMVPFEVPNTSIDQVKGEITDAREMASANLPDGASVEFTGPAAIQTDLANVFSGANFILLAVTGAIVAILLIFTYRSPVLWLIPLIVIGIADRFAAVTFTHLHTALGLVWDESTPGILSVLVFGAGTDYALLLISRYRDELRHVESRFEAMRRAWLPTVKAVVASASTVMLGLLCLLLSETPAIRGLGLACAYGVVVAASFALLALPGALVAFGRWIFWPRVPTPNSEVHAGVWDRVGQGVEKRPVLVIAVSLGFLALAALGGLGSKEGLTTEDQFLDTPESIVAAQNLEKAFPNADSSPETVIAKDVPATKAAIEGTGAKVMSEKQGDGFTSLQVSGTTTEELRSTLADTGALVGGPEAQNIDKVASAKHDQKLIFPIVALLVTLALAALLRSIVAPIIMVATVLMTYAAAMGLSWIVFTQFMGFSALAEGTPLFAFVFLVALGVDYNIFLIARAKEESERMGTHKGILKALSATGGVITSAGILLAAVFAALGVLPLVVMAQLGIVIFIGVLLDTLLVRTVLVPAIVLLLGDKFWWPSRPAKAAS